MKIYNADGGYKELNDSDYEVITINPEDVSNLKNMGMELTFI